MSAGSAAVSRSGNVLAWICAGHTLSHVWILTLPPLFPALAAAFDISFVQLGVLITLYSLTNGIFQVPSGYLVDRYGAKPVLIGGLLLNGIAFALYGVAPNYTTLLALALIAGIGQSVFHPADYSVLSATFSKERAGKPYSIHTFSGYAGSAVAPITIAGLYTVIGWQGAFAVSGLAGVVLAVLMALWLKAPRGERTEAAESGAVQAGAQAQGGGSGWRMSLFFSQALLLMFVFYVFTSMTSSGVQAFVPSSLTQLYQIPLSTANIALTIYLTTLAFGILLGGFIADKVRSNHAQVVGALFACGMLLMFLLAMVHMPLWLLFAVFAVAGAFHGVIMPSRDKMVREASPEGAAGKSFGFVSTGLSLGSMVAPILLGFILDAGRPSLVFWSIAFFMLIAVLTTFAPRHGFRWRSPTEKQASG